MTASLIYHYGELVAIVDGGPYGIKIKSLRHMVEMGYSWVPGSRGEWVRA